MVAEWQVEDRGLAGSSEPRTWQLHALKAAESEAHAGGTESTRLTQPWSPRMCEDRSARGPQARGRRSSGSSGLRSGATFSGHLYRD